MLVIDTEEVSSEESTVDDISDSEWSSVIILAPPKVPVPCPLRFPSTQLLPTPTLRRGLRAHKSTIG